jgi:L-cystine uptake protein TcyP (sodium:dicarboxylate symporter family)
VVIFAVFLGLAALQLIKDDAEKGGAPCRPSTPCKPG